MTSTAMKLSECRKLFFRARAAGEAAGKAHQPVPMIVEEHANPLDDSSPVVRRYAPVASGVCGFAWVKVRPANSRFAKWVKKNGYGDVSGYEGGLTIWISDYGQSYEKKVAHAAAMANVLREAGIQAYVGERID